jgi:hypothetical protein
MTLAFRRPELLTMAEVAEALRVPVSTLRYWRSRGEGPKSFALGRRVVYDIRIHRIGQGR